MIKRIVILLVGAIVLSGCTVGGTPTTLTSTPQGSGGIPTTPTSTPQISEIPTITAIQQVLNLGEEPIDKPLLDQFKTRIFYERDDILLYELDDVPGSFLICTVNDEVGNESCSFQYPGIRKEGVTPSVATPDKVVYNSKVELGGNAEVSVFLGSLGISGEGVAEVTITDATSVSYSLDDIPVNELQAYVSNRPNTDKDKIKRYWIRGMRVSTIVRKDYTKFTGNLSGVVGPITGIKGSVYKSEKNDVVEYRVSFILVNIDTQFSGFIPGSPSAPPSTSTTVPGLVPQALPGSALVIETIEGLDQLPKIKREEE